MNKKIIGIPVWSNSETSMAGVGKAYVEYWSQYGQVVMLMPGEEIRKDLDLLVLPGGADVDTNRYKAVPSFTNGYSNPFLEWFDKNMLHQYIEAKVPIFATCRGAQSLAVHFGVPLVQNLIYHPHSGDNRSKLVHKSLPAYLPDGEKMLVDLNSLHHQGIDANVMEQHDDFVIICKNYKKVKCKDEEGKLLKDKAGNQLYEEHGDNIVEMFRHRSLPIVAQQFHTEEMYDWFSMQWIEWLFTFKSIYKQEETEILETTN